MNNQLPPPVIMFMGPPGSGKGTQAQLLQEQYRFQRVETGALLRSMRNDPSPAAAEVTRVIDSGKLAPPPLVADLVIRTVRKHLQNGHGVVLDGSPRTLYEAEQELSELRENQRDRIMVVVLDVPKPETVTRILRRWVCVKCKRPIRPGEQAERSCKACGGEMQKRADDTAEVVDKRWEEYTFRTLPVIEYFDRAGLVAHVNGHDTVPNVAKQVQEALRARLGI